MVSHNPRYSTQQYLTGIRENDSAVVQSIIREYLPGIKQFIRQNNGTHQDGEDIFQDAMEALYRKTKFDGLTDLSCAFYSFLFEICKRLWYKKLRRKNRDAEVTPEELMVFSGDEDPQEALEKTERHGLLWEKFILLGEDCRRLLEMAMSTEKKSGEIAEILGYASSGYVRKKKHECKEKWIGFIQSDPRYRELRTAQTK